MLQISNALAIIACDALVDQIDSGSSGAAKLQIYDGAKPATLADAITTQNVLVEFDLPNPAFAGAVEGANGATATANAVTDTVALADGEATFFRIINRDGEAVLQGDVTDVGGNGDLKLSSISIITGIEVVVVSLTATMPNGNS